MPYKPHERPVKPHTIDRRSEKAAQQAAVAKSLKPQSQHFRAGRQRHQSRPQAGQTLKGATMAKSIFGGRPAIAHAGAADPALAAEFQDTACHGAFTLLTGTADPIPFPGNVAVNSAGVNAMTLNPPLPGPQPLGDDGKTIFVVALNAAAHTITTPANKILGSKHLATFTAAIGNNITLTAFNGVWVPNRTPVGVTVS